MRFRMLPWILAHAVLAAPAFAGQANPPRLYAHLSLSRTHIAFALAGDVWVVPRGGGTAARVTTGPEDDSNPCFSPDGRRIAFSRAIGGNADVYVVPASGGTPVRLTFHPASELVRDWSVDGADILFTAARGLTWQSRLYAIPANGGPSRELPIPLAWNGVFAADGRIVYNAREVIGRYATSWRVTGAARWRRSPSPTCAPARSRPSPPIRAMTGCRSVPGIACSSLPTARAASTTSMRWTWRPARRAR
jgi:tricorn protease